MKNKGIKIGVVFILLFALLSVAGCQQEDVVIVGAESGQPGPTSGQLRIGFTLLVSKGASDFYGGCAVGKDGYHHGRLWSVRTPGSGKGPIHTLTAISNLM